MLAAVLAAAAVAKLSAPDESRRALITFGLRGDAAQWTVLVAVVAFELALAGGVAAGFDAAPWAAAGLLAVFAAASGAALARGREGAPCACFGARSRLSRRAVARDAALAAAFTVVPVLPHGDLSTDAWLAAGLAVALIAVAGLAVAVLALAREVGMLR